MAPEQRIDMIPHPAVDLSPQLRKILRLRAGNLFDAAVAQLITDAPLDLSPIGISGEELCRMVAGFCAETDSAHPDQGAGHAQVETRLLPTGTVRISGVATA